MNKKLIKRTIVIALIIIAIALALSGCEKSPEQKANELEREVDKELKDKGIDYEYEQYYDEVEKVVNGMISVEDVIQGDAKESYNNAMEETEDEDFRNFDLNLASDSVLLETENLAIDIDKFESNETGYEVPKEYKQFHEDFIKKMKHYNSLYHEFGLSLKPENDYVNAKDKLIKIDNEFESDEEFKEILKKTIKLEKQARENN